MGSDEFCFVGGGAFAAALLAGESGRKPPVGLLHQRGQFVPQALSAFLLLHHKTKLLVREMRIFLALEGKCRIFGF